jgi:hypothetical protein
LRESAAWIDLSARGNTRYRATTFTISFRMMVGEPL